MDGQEAWDYLRLTRSRPPGHARKGEPAALYRAALQQSEDLMRAAKATGRAGRPLPLFYSLTQAGKAIEARYGVPETTSHGLAMGSVAGGLLDTDIRIARAGTGRFRSVSGCLGSTVPSQNPKLGALIASLPELAPALPDSAQWRRPIRVMDMSPQFAMFGPGHHPVGIDFGRSIPKDRGVARRRLANYPSEQGRLGSLSMEEDLVRDGESWARGLPGFWDLSDPPGSKGNFLTFDELVPPYDDSRRRWLRPAIVPKEHHPSALMTWWLVLYELSMYARYHPTRWVRALDVDSSVLAVLLDRSMSEAIERVPVLVLEALR